MSSKRKLIFGVVLCLPFIAGAALYVWLFKDLPSPEDLSVYATTPSSKVYDRYGRLLFEMPPPYTGSHSPITLSEIPDALRWATIATEDATFYTNPGMDAWAILRAVWINVRGGDILAGGSTITQQLVRVLMFAPEERVERTLHRKLREIILAVRITRRYTKDEILTFYLNETYYGNMAYGVEAAAQAYFGKSARDLDLAECAMLAGLPQAPAIHNPLENLESARQRQQVVLNLMQKQGYITEDAVKLAKEEPLAFAAAPFPIRAPHFVMYVRGLLERELGTERLQAGGLNITTTLDVDLNETARDIMRQQLSRLAMCNYQPTCSSGGYNVRNAAVIALDPRTGEVLAMVGSPDYFSQRIDGAVNGTTALRQPGSSIKPLTYAAAFETGDLTPATMMLDERTAFITREGMPYVPLNYDLKFRGPVRLREALASSYNLLAVKVLDTIGIETMTRLARRLGITTFDNPDRIGLSITLGGGEVRLLELAAAYATFANGGMRTHPQVVQRVTDQQGRDLSIASTQWKECPTCSGERVLDARVAYLITDILQDELARVPTFGEESVLNLSHPAAVKTGTTTDFRDNWTVGYTPNLVVGVWVGNADNEPMRDVTGLTGAAPIWHAVMESALKGHPVQGFSQPEGLREVEVCALSGMLPGPECPHHVTELFIKGTEPTQICTLHPQVEARDSVLTPEAPTISPDAEEQATEETSESSTEIEPAGRHAKPLVLTRPDPSSIFRLDPALPRNQQKIIVAAKSNLYLKQLTFLVDGTSIAILTAPPYTSLWQLEPGEHTLSVTGLDANNTLVTGNEIRIRVLPAP